MTKEDFKACADAGLDMTDLAKMVATAAAACGLVGLVLVERRKVLEAEIAALGRPQRAGDELYQLQDGVDRIDEDIETLRAVLLAWRLLDQGDPT